MKKIVSKMVLGLLIGLLLSCGSMPVVNVVPKDNESLVIIRRTTNYYGAAIELEVLIDGTSVGTLQSGKERKFAVPNGQHTITVQHPVLFGGNMQKEISFEAYFQQVTFATGFPGVGTLDLVKVNETVLPGREQQYENRNRLASDGIAGVLEMAAKDVAANFTARSRIAIVYITAQDRGTTEFITGELEHILRRGGYQIVDRSELDRVRAEQRFGSSGEVDDNTAASIGQFAGADIVITGRVDGEGNLRRLRLRALDTTSGRVVGTASERLE